MTGVIGRVRRYAVVADPTGPRIRFGVLWFLVLAGGLALGPVAVAVVLAAASSVAALQLSGSWRRAGSEVSQALAGASAATLTLAALVNNTVLGATLMVLAVGSVLIGDEIPAIGPLIRRRGVPNGTEGPEGPRGTDAPGDAGADGWRFEPAERFAVGGAALRSWLFVGLATAATVQVERVSTTSFIFLVVALSVYDAGSFLCGADADSRWVGPVAGIMGVAVWTAAMWQYEPEPLKGSQTIVVGAVIAFAAPVGELLASWLLPAPRIRCPALRRLDSWLIAAPALLVGLWIAAPGAVAS